MELSGKVIAVLDARSGVAKSTGNSWMAQEYVIETVQDQYPKKMCFEVFGEEKIKQFNIQMGEQLNVSFDIDAREWNGRWFNSLRAWKVERMGNEMPAQPGMAAQPAMGAPVAPADFGSGDASDDLPF